MKSVTITLLLISCINLCIGAAPTVRINFDSKGMKEVWGNGNYYHLPIKSNMLKQEGGRWILAGGRGAKNYLPTGIASPEAAKFKIKNATASSKKTPGIPGGKALLVKAQAGAWSLTVPAFEISSNFKSHLRTKEPGVVLSFYAKSNSGNASVKVSILGMGYVPKKLSRRQRRRLKGKKPPAQKSLEMFKKEQDFKLTAQWKRYKLSVKCLKRFKAMVNLTMSGTAAVEFAGMQLENVGEHPNYSWNPSPWLPGGTTRKNADPRLPAPMFKKFGEIGAIAMNVKLQQTVSADKPNARYEILVMGRYYSIGAPMAYIYKGKTKIRLHTKHLSKMMNDGRYHWLVLSWDKRFAKLMVDNKQVARAKIRGANDPAKAPASYLSVFPDAHWKSPPNGSLREIRFFDKPLTSVEIVALSKEQFIENELLLDSPARWVFHRDEKSAVWYLQLRGDVSGWTAAVKNLPQAQTELQSDGTLKIKFSPALLKAGKKKIEIKLSKGSQSISFVRELNICPARPRDHFGIVNWPGRRMNSKSKRNWYKKLGINTLCGPIGSVQYQNDLAAMGFYSWYRWHFMPKTPHPMTVNNQEKTRVAAQQTAEIVRNYPWMVGCLLNSEGHGNSNIEKAPKLLAQARKRFGFKGMPPVKSGTDLDNFSLRPALDLRKFANSGLVPDDYMPLRYAMWVLTYGDGFGWTGGEIKRIIQKQSPQMKFVVEPNIWLPGRLNWADIVAQWRYADDNAFILGKYRNTSDRAKSLGLGFCPLVGLNYDGSQRYLVDAKGRKTKKVVPSPAMAAADVWLVLGSQCKQFYFYNLEGYSPKGNKIRWIRPGFYERIEKILTEFKRLASVVAPLPRPKARLALLYSHTNSLGLKKQQWWHSFSKLIYKLRAELVRNNVQSDLLFERDIKKGALKHYDKLYFPSAHYLKDSTWKTIAAWRKDGGKLVIDNASNKAYRSRADKFIDIIRFEGGMKAPYIKKTEMNAWLNSLPKPAAALRGKVYIMPKKAGDSTIYVVVNNGWKETVLKNSSAEKSSDIMSELAEIKERNKGNMKLNKPLFDTGIKQQVKLALAVSSKNAAAYLMNTGQIIPSKYNAGKKELLLDLALEPGQGRVIAVTPRPIGKVKINVRNGVLDIALQDKRGKNMRVNLGVKVEITQADGKLFDASGIYRLVNGKTRIELNIPLKAVQGNWKVKVTCLASGLNASSTFKVNQ